MEESQVLDQEKKQLLKGFVEVLQKSKYEQQQYTNKKQLENEQFNK
jgi:hypothetical protein